MLLSINITRELLIAGGFTAAFGLMFFISEMIYAKLKVDAEVTRKFIHISCGTIAMLVPIFMPSPYTIIILGCFFSILTAYMLSKGLLPSVHAVKRHSIGSVLFPLGIVACAVFGMVDNYQYYFYIPLANLIYSDTVAAMVGINYPIQKFSIRGFNKSIGGSLGFFTSAMLIATGFLYYFKPEFGMGMCFGIGVLFGICTAIIEMFSVDGWDDLSVPIGSFLLLLLI